MHSSMHITSHIAKMHCIYVADTYQRYILKLNCRYIVLMYQRMFPYYVRRTFFVMFHQYNGYVAMQHYCKVIYCVCLAWCTQHWQNMHTIWENSIISIIELHPEKFDIIFFANVTKRHDQWHMHDIGGLLKNDKNYTCTCISLMLIWNISR